MIETQKGIILVGIVFCLFITFNCPSASDYYVNSDTTHKNISDWMNNDAKKGDSLIFNTTHYNLSDTLIISKSVNVKSYKNTKINFILDRNMFYITASSVNFTNLRLKHVYNGEADEDNDDFYGMIVTDGSYKEPYKKINIKNIDINYQIKNYLMNSAIHINKWKGDVKNCNISTKGKLCGGIDVYNNWKGSIINSKIRTEGKYSLNTIMVSKWEGNIINSNISSFGPSSRAIDGDYWSGKIVRCKIYSFNTEKYPTYPLAAVYLPNSKGLIYKTTIKQPNAYAIMISDDVKINKCNLTSKKGLKKYYRCRPELTVYNVKKSKNMYYITIENHGDTDSKPCYISIKTGKIFKKVKIRSLMSYDDYQTVKVKLPTKYTNKYYTKYIKIDYYNQNKENNKKNNYYKFKF